MKKRNKTVIAALVILSLVFGVGGVAAKYVTSSEKVGHARALEFYLTSNMLPGAHDLAPGTTSVSFTVGNYEDDLRFAEMDIHLTIDTGTASKTVTYRYWSNDQWNTITDEEKKYLWEDHRSEAIVTLSGLQDGETYTVTVTGEGGYTKTLTGTFTVLSPEAGPFYYIQDKEGYTEVTVWCRGIASAADVTISYPETAIPDNTDPNMAAWLSDAGNRIIKLDPYNSYSYRFFNTEAKDITVTATGIIEKKPE